MNKIYKVLWNHAAQNWVVTSELARGNVKSSTSQLTNQLTDQPTSQLKKSFTIATLSAVIIASLFSTSAMAYTPNANGREQAVTGSLAIGEQDDGSGSGSGATVSASNGGSSTAGWTTTTNSHHSIAIGGSSLVNNTANALAIGFKANLNNSTKGNVALGAYSTAGAAHAGGDAASIHIGGTTYDFAGKATNQTSVLSIGSGNYVRDWAAGPRQSNGGHYSDRQGANTPNYSVRQIQNVAAGRVSSDSTDAINGSQLHAVVQAINASSNYVWKVKSEGGKNSSEQAVSKNETVTFAAGNNMEVMQDPNDLKKFIYSTKNDVTFNKVTVGGNEFTTNGLTIGNGGPSMTKTGINAGKKQITNVANGTNNTDAVNVSQLNAAKSNVVAGTNVANVTTTTNADKSKTYTVNAIGTNVTSNSNLITATKTATANNTNNQTNTYTIGLKTKNVTANKDSGKYDEIPATEEDGVVTAKALLEALKKAGWKLQANSSGNTIIKAGDYFANATSVATAINSAFWRATGAGKGTGHTEQPIHAGDLVTFKGGNGIKVDQNAGTFTFSLDEEYIKTHPGLKGPKGDKGAQGARGLQGLAGKDGKNAVASVTTNQDGTHTINITDGNGTVSSAIVKNGKDGEKGEDGKNAVASVTNNNDGTHTIKITDGNNKSTTTIVKDGKDGKNGTGGSGPNSDDGLKFTGNNEVVNNNKLNSKVIIKGEGVSKVKSETFKSAKGNINVKADGNATLEMQLAKDIDLGNDGSVTTGNTVINNNGITINNAAPNKTVSVTENGLNNGGNRIINVAPGIKGTDAVNVNQLRGAVNNIHNDMNKMDKRLSAGIAGAMSSANLYQATSSGKSMLSAGAGTYRGESAVAVGYSRLSDNGKFGVRFSANTNSRGDAGAAASVGYQW